MRHVKGRMNDMTRDQYVLKPLTDNEDLIKERTKAGIEQYRKGWGTVKVVDRDGKPVEGAVVTVKQKTHDFHYGANLFMLDEFETEEKNAVYRETFRNYFNFATVPFYWDTLEPEEGKPRYEKGSPRVYRRPTPDLCLEYCEENGIAAKAHCLHYDHFSPAWLEKYTVAEQWKLLEKRFSQCAERYRNRIHGWEVTNESYWKAATTKLYYEPDFMERSFAMAARYFPQNELICNEGGEPFREFFCYNRNPYFMQVERAKLKGARIDTVGFQHHIWSTPENEAEVVRKMLDPVNSFRVFDTFAQFGCPYQITEVTFPCHTPDSREAEDLQAELLRRLYTLWFGIPQMEAIVYWNVVDGYAHNAQPGDFTAGENKLAGGLMRFDMTPKPALRMIKHLFDEVWHTEEELHTNAAGSARFRGFYGNYDVTVSVGEHTETFAMHLEKRAESMPVTAFTV